MDGNQSPKHQYDPGSLLDSQPTIISVIAPATHRVVFQNKTSREKFGDLSARTCYEAIANCAAPCSFCRMPEAVATGALTASEVPLSDDQHLLVQWARVETSDGQAHVVETITDITALKRQEREHQLLIRQLKQTNRDLVEVNQQLHDRSTRDGLTGLYNHSYFQSLLSSLIAQAQRTGSSVSLLFLDLDDFKVINDSFGHATGDQVLREIGGLLDGQYRAGDGRRVRRASDVAARYGGEEFALILPNTDLPGALVVAELLRHRVTTLSSLPELAPLDRSAHRLSWSIGVAAYPLHAVSAADLLAAADAAVYAAKTAGKNCIRVAEAKRLSDRTGR
ncbi:putative Diguanylate cyclase [Nitrospira tepida]|uniref:diguanylate cyclase n=1 Tax=Nitrospira tepida TaxID=2973512 RepID=A0AA86T7R7_9BACT|nr:diguanylate cyclase [Nitrospira tepida]CAI4033256.1 putative Diguanylate cyclase [Nitrospira tepida]